MTASRTFTEAAEPPFGERITMMTPTGEYLVWTGKRWYWEAECDGSLQCQDAWPPDEPGPYFEVIRP